MQTMQKKSFKKSTLLTGLLLTGLLLGLTACSKTVQTPVDQAATNKFTLPKTASIYLVALNDNGKTGTQIGCGDSLVPVEIKFNNKEKETPINAALEKLLAIKEQKDSKTGLYNGLFQSNLKIEKITSDRQNKTGIYLTGTVALAGTCDTPRFEEQLKATVMQFTQWVSSVEIFINGKPMAEALSSK